jgi:hypothetical protein
VIDEWTAPALLSDILGVSQKQPSYELPTRGVCGLGDSADARPRGRSGASRSPEWSPPSRRHLADLSTAVARRGHGAKQSAGSIAHCPTPAVPEDVLDVQHENDRLAALVDAYVRVRRISTERQR